MIKEGAEENKNEKRDVTCPVTTKTDAGHRSLSDLAVSLDQCMSACVFTSK